MLNNRIGMLLYLLLQNDLSWKYLSGHERQVILQINRRFNIERSDYAQPEKYGAGRNERGENWDSYRPREDDKRGLELIRILDENLPRRVLEVGPGAGYYSRAICEHPSVKYYMAVDIGRKFLKYLMPRLEKLSGEKYFRYSLICGELTRIALRKKFDLIVMLSVVHHIPNREELFRNLFSMLAPNGLIFCFDPAHYIIRICRLLYKCMASGYLAKEFFGNTMNLSTHHMCTYREYKKICQRIRRLQITNVFYDLPVGFR